MTDRAIFRCERKACGHTWAHDYERTRSGRERRRLDGSSAAIADDMACPRCGRRAARWGFVRGHYVAGHKCGARCRLAIGFVCVCDCGGKQHGSHWLAQPVLPLGHSITNALELLKKALL